MKLSAIPISLALSLAAGASAASKASESLNSISVLEVLATALPQSLVNLAITNPAAASSVISSEFAHSETPGWYSKLPTPIQTYLVPVTTISQAPSVVVSGLPTQITSLASLTFSSIPKPPMNMTHNATMTTRSKHTSKTTTIIRTTHHMTMPGGGNGGNGGNGGGGSSPSSGGASVPTGVVGAGLAGVVGVVGLLAL